MQGDLSPEESVNLLAGCREDTELGRRFVRLMQVESIAGLVLEEDDEGFAQEVRYRVEAEGDDDFSAEMASRLKRGKILRWVVGWAAAAALDQRDASLLRLSLRRRLSLRLRLCLCFRLCLSVCLCPRFRRRLRRRELRRELRQLRRYRRRGK